MQDPRKLLTRIVNLIDRDTRAIKGKRALGKLDHGDARDLCMYSNALLNIIHDHDSLKEREKEKLSKLSTAELKALAATVLDKEKSNAAKKEKEV